MVKATGSGAREHWQDMQQRYAGLVTVKPNKKAEVGVLGGSGGAVAWDFVMSGQAKADKGLIQAGRGRGRSGPAGNIAAAVTRAARPGSNPGDTEATATPGLAME